VKAEALFLFTQKYKFTKEMDQEIIDYYKNRFYGGLCLLAEKFDVTSTVIYKRAKILGAVTRVKWTMDELKVLEKFADRPAFFICKELEKLGYKRTSDSIREARRRYSIRSSRNYLTTGDVAYGFGVTIKTVLSWHKSGWLKSTSLGTKRGDRQKEDLFYFKEVQVYNFIKKYNYLIDLSKVVKEWFFDIIFYFNDRKNSRSEIDIEE
jgi:hypothetical protein